MQIQSKIQDVSESIMKVEVAQHSKVHKAFHRRGGRERERFKYSRKVMSLVCSSQQEATVLTILSTIFIVGDRKTVINLALLKWLILLDLSSRVWPSPCPNEKGHFHKLSSWMIHPKFMESEQVDFCYFQQNSLITFWCR